MLDLGARSRCSVLISILGARSRCLVSILGLDLDETRGGRSPFVNSRSWSRSRSRSRCSVSVSMLGLDARSRSRCSVSISMLGLDLDLDAEMKVQALLWSQRKMKAPGRGKFLTRKCPGAWGLRGGCQSRGLWASCQISKHPSCSALHLSTCRASRPCQSVEVECRAPQMQAKIVCALPL